MAESALNEQKVGGADSSDGKHERELSTIDFPYTSLDDAVEVAKAVNKLGGNECRLDPLAAELRHDTVKSGGFRQRLASARIFGLTSLSKGIVSLSSLGAQIVDPEQEKAARVEAFLTVPLYKAIYEDFKSGTPLPPAQGLESKMVSLGVSNKQKDKARQVFQRSAKEAGFFAYGSTKLVYPAVGNSVVPPKPKDDHSKDDPDSGRKNGGNGGGGGRHPLIDGLIRALPRDGAWPKEARRKWLQAAAMNFDFVYDEDPSETKSIKVSLE